MLLFVGWLVGCQTFQQLASVSQGRICSGKCMWCDSEIEVTGQTYYLTQSQYTDTGPTSPRSNFLSHPVTVYWHWANQSQVKLSTSPSHSILTLGQPVPGQTFYLTQSQYSDTGPTSPRSNFLSHPVTVYWHWANQYQVKLSTSPSHSILTLDQPVPGQTFYLTQSQYSDTGPTSPRSNFLPHPITVYWRWANQSQVKLSISPSHSILTLGQPVPGQTFYLTQSQYTLHWANQSQVKLSISPNHSILTLGQPVPGQTFYLTQSQYTDTGPASSTKHLAG